MNGVAIHRLDLLALVGLLEREYFGHDSPAAKRALNGLQSAVEGDADVITLEPALGGSVLRASFDEPEMSGSSR